MYITELNLVRNTLNVNVLNYDLNQEEYEYAFYLYRNNKRVEIKWYEKNSQHSFYLDNNTGVYFVKAFLRKSKNSDLIIFDSEELVYKGSSYNIKNWDYELNRIGQNYFANLENLTLKDGLYQLECEYESIDFLFEGMSKIKKENGILVCLSGAVGDRENKQAPFFSGLNIAKTLNMPIISIADPSLNISNDISLGWYAGNENLKNLPQIIANTLDSISKKLNTKMIFFGGSGGGFASLSIINHMEEKAYGLVWNPQTSISKYYKSHVINYIEKSFHKEIINSNLYSSLDKIGIVHDVTKLYAKTLKKEACILYLQNSDDTFHVENHLYPIMNAVKAKKDNDHIYSSSAGILFWVKCWGKGHTSPNSSMILEILRRIINDDDINSIALSLE
ncbi:MAG: hypothetical protein ACI9ST_000350 [Psychrobacter glaciei]|jgi:hypothetical protein|uniref:hypothetical protein n=1 Tax=Psychrobacter glaciei TaxID=619771 RepID=UPI0039E25E78